MNEFLKKLKVNYYRIISYRYWEFWSANIFYIPIVFYYLVLSFKYRISLTAISSVNPCFAFGGMAFDSKFDMISKFFHFPDYIAKTIFVPEKSKRDLQVIQKEILENNIHFPFICKPDRGHRGNGFKIIRTKENLVSYLEECPRAFLIQEYIDYPLEYGIFWIRIPGEEKGRIISITRKILPFVKGDGKLNLSELILSDSRARYMANIYFEKNKMNLNQVIEKDLHYKICNAGNHCQGAIFEDGKSDLSKLTLEMLEKICSSVKGYDFGRMDIKFKNLASLSNGKDFKILEVNGSEAEFTHIYDRKYNLMYAYKTLYEQWDLLFKIARINRDNGFFGLPAIKLVMAYLDFFKENKMIKSD